MTDSRLVTWFSRQMRLHQNRLMKRAGEAGKALRAIVHFVIYVI